MKHGSFTGNSWELIKLTNVKYIFKKESYVSKEEIIIDTQDIGG